MTYIDDRPLSETERETMLPVIERLAHHEAELVRARDELNRLCLLARDYTGQILDTDRLVWQRPAEESEAEPARPFLQGED